MFSEKAVAETMMRDATKNAQSTAHVIASCAPCSAWVAVNVAAKSIVAEAGAVGQRLREVAIDQVVSNRRRLNGLRKIRARAGFADLVAVSLVLPGEQAIVVTLARLAGETAFAATELSAVRNKVQALRSLRKFPEEPEALASLASIRRRAPVSAFIVDRNLVVISSSVRDEHLVAVGEADGESRLARIRLPRRIERIVRDALEDWPREFQDSSSETVVPLGALVIRLVPMRGRFNDHVGIFIERARSTAQIEGVAQRFQISSRELEVARLLIKGLSAEEVGATLSIAETTVAAHVRSIIMKTASRNRTEAIAKLLGR